MGCEISLYAIMLHTFLVKVWLKETVEQLQMTWHVPARTRCVFNTFLHSASFARQSWGTPWQLPSVRMFLVGILLTWHSCSQDSVSCHYLHKPPEQRPKLLVVWSTDWLRYESRYWPLQKTILNQLVWPSVNHQPLKSGLHPFFYNHFCKRISPHARCLAPMTPRLIN